MSSFPRIRFALWAVLTALTLLAAPTAWTKVGITTQSPLGNPDSAVTDPASRTKYLIQRNQYHLSYNDNTHQANWVGWSYSTADDGSQPRTDAWAVEELLPSGYLRIGTSAFGTSFGISWDRGHMTPSADRTLNFTDNAVTFRMSNIIPQADANNQGLWAQFETYCRGLASGGNEVLIISGPSEFTGNRIPNSMSVPGSVWKIAVVVPNATSTTPANQRITTSARVIAILTPNVSSGLGSWQSYITSVEEVEEVTGLNFFTAVDPSTAIYLKNVVDTGTGPNSPTVITTFNPTLGAPGSSVVINGYNFGGSPSVSFNGATATVTAASSNSITATIPAGATTGPINVTGPGGTDTSYENFTVSSGPVTPVITVSPATIAGMTATEGAAGTSQVYGVNGSSLTAAVTITAPANFEISADSTTFSSSLTLTPAIDGSLGTQINVRIKSNAPIGSVSGNITHDSAGATSKSVSVSGSVISSLPHLTLSTASLTGFTAFSGSAGAAKSYTVSGANLTGSITVTAPTGYEVSLDNSTFAATRTLAPAGGTIPTTTIYARLNASAALGTVEGSITHAGGGAPTQSLALSGTVNEPSSGSSTIVWDFQTTTPTSGVPVDLTVGAIAQGNNNGTTTLLTTTSASTGYTGASGNNNAGAAARVGALSTASGGSAYFEFTVTPSAGRTLTLSEISFGARSTSTGPQAYSLRSSADNYASDIATGTIPATSTWTLKSNTGLNRSYSFAVTFRIYGYNGSGSASASTANWRIDDLKLVVATSATLPATPVITVAGPATATAYEAFSYQIQADGSPTAYAASGLPAGLSINTATGLISGTPTTPGTYSVGLTATNAGGDGTATLTIIVQANPNAPLITSNLLANGQIDAAFNYQITASNTPSSYTAANLPPGLGINTTTGLISGTPTAGGTFNATITALNSFGSDSETLQIVIRVPALILTPDVLNAFTADAGLVSATQSYTLSGSDLTDSITVRAPQYFEISTNGSLFAPELTLSPAANGTLSQGIIVRLANSAPPGLVTGALSHTGSGAIPKYLEVSGTVSTASPTITVSATELAPFSTVTGTASSIQTYEVSGASLGSTITITPPTGFEVGTDDESFGVGVQLTPSASGALSPTAIYVRVRNDATAGSYAGTITHSGGGAVAKLVSVTATVTVPAGPNIVASSGGSAYVNTGYSYTIATDGLQTVTSYSAGGLPTGLTLNSSTGTISGTPTVAGTYNVTLGANGSQGSSTKAYTLRVITAGEQPSTPPVVINKYHNAATDRVELLVTGDNIAGPPVDLRGMTFKDFNGNMATDGGGKYVFKDHPLWSNVKAGTLIVLAAGNTLAEDTDAADFVLAVNLANATYFTQEAGGFDIGNTDMVMIKPAGMQPDGVAGGMHVLAAGNAGTQYLNFTGRKTKARRELSANRGYFCFVVNGSTSLADFYTLEGADLSALEAFGTGNNSNNTTFINNLRAQDQDGPAITVSGSNPINVPQGTTYTDAGATAFDAGDNASKTVTTTGSVDTATAGTYTITYTATDSKGNVGTAARTVIVLAPASTPPTVTSSAAGSVTATSAILSGNVTSAGTSTVSARGFVYSTVNTTLEFGAPGVTAAASGTGTGAFSAEISGLSGGTTYYFRAFATNESGTSYGGALSFTTLKAEPQQYPQNFAAGTVTTSQIPATWTTTDADGYVLMVSSSTITPPTDGVVMTDDADVSDGSGVVTLAGNLATYNGFIGFAPGETYTFVIYPFNNNGSATDYKTANPPTFTTGVLTTPELSVSGSPAALTTTYGTPSTAATFTVSGAYLTSTVSVTAPGGFEVSSDNTSFDTSVVLTPTAATLSSTTVYLRLAATAVVGGSHNAQSVSVSGGGAESVSVTTAASGNDVAAKILTISAISGVDKVYDGSTTASVDGTPNYEGLANGENFSVSGTVTWTFLDKSVGVGKALVRNGNFTAPSANYTVTQPSLTASITTKQITVTGASVTTKTYDGNTSATITGATLSGVVEGDTVTVSGDGTFSDANAGTNKPVTTSLLLGGADATNYSLTQPSLTGTILKADQTITFAELPAKNLGDAPFSLSGTTTSGLTVSYSSSNPAVASVSGSTVTILSVGTATITATQSGNSNYNAATPVARTLTVTNAPTLVAGWDFQTTSNGGTAAAAAPATPKIYIANFGSGTIHLDGTNGSSDWFVPTSGSTGTEVNGFGGTAVNATRGLSTVTTSPAALAILGGTSNAANGKRIVFAFSMAGRANLNITYATQRTTAGFNSQQWEYSSDGTNWAPLATIASGEVAGTITTAFGTTGAISLPTVTALDNATTAYLRLTVTGATSSTGNNRLDNIQLAASTIVPPDTTAPVITLFGDNPLTLPVGATFTDPGATALDNIDGAMDVAASGEVNTAVPGSYTIIYTATDAAANTATATRTVNVVDVTAPVITVSGSNPLYLPVGATFVEPGVNALDAIDGDIDVQTSGTVDTAARGTYILTYTATDAAGNTATATREVVVRSGAAHALASQYGLTGSEAALTADADGDGAANLMEYALGNDPSSGGDFPASSELILFAEAVRFSAVVRADDSALTVTPRRTSNLLSTWTTENIAEVTSTDQSNVPSGFIRRTWEVSDPGPDNLFIRLEVGYE